MIFMDEWQEDLEHHEEFTVEVQAMYQEAEPGRFEIDQIELSDPPPRGCDIKTRDAADRPYQ